MSVVSIISSTTSQPQQLQRLTREALPPSHR
jgi:hypothetical protein